MTVTEDSFHGTEKCSSNMRTDNEMHSCYDFSILNWKAEWKEWRYVLRVNRPSLVTVYQITGRASIPYAASDFYLSFHDQTSSKFHPTPCFIGTVGSFRNQVAGQLSLIVQPCILLRSRMRGIWTGTGCLEIIQVFKNNGTGKVVQICHYAVFPFAFCYCLMFVIIRCFLWGRNQNKRKL
jgi:hypothetical protein